MYLQYHASKKVADNPILFYALCLLYMLCVAMISADLVGFFHKVSNNERIFYTTLTLISCAEHYYYSSHSIRLL